MSINFDIVKTTGMKTVMKLRKISPELALGAGIACGIGAIVAGCLASRKVDALVEETQNDLDILQDEIEAGHILEPKKVTFRVYSKTAWEFTKLYAPTIGLTMASVGFILASHGVLKKRYMGTLAAYHGLDEAFKAYRKRVAASVGEEAERIIMAGGHTEKNIKIENDDGTVETKKTNSVVLGDNTKKSPYEFDFNKHTSMLWDPNPDHSEIALRNVQNWANDLLNSRGHIFLNEVLDALGMQRTPAGAVCGWVKGCGDDYVDFGYWDTFYRDYQLDSDLCRKNIHLNFNCDGVIWDMI